MSLHKALVFRQCNLFVLKDLLFTQHSYKMATADGDVGEENGKLSDFKIIHKKGDLFSCPEDESLAHCVSEDLRMGKGIATLFKKNFEGVPELKAQGKKVGDVAILKHGKRFVYYLITKPKYFDKPTYATLEDSLRAMQKHCVEHNVTAVSMPKIGCGLDKLQWPKVEETLMSVFMDTNIVISVYSL
ncbi:ADP-ribose glycohydrolase OARD1-like [Dreissena polymorpha]|uniref:ADP-ribose glycohydrolase OARD1-like n=1 Tax=Dreissena polymorpha TaxID=45954 RepID=UPI002264D2BF|nr:ADP-ribose glycohydrolase OARD1-like [Dreissena polymorpha]